MSSVGLGAKEGHCSVTAALKALIISLACRGGESLADFREQFSFYADHVSCGFSGKCCWRKAFGLFMLVETVLPRVFVM